MDNIRASQEFKEGDVVRHTKYAQPLEVVKVVPIIRQAETVPLDTPGERPKRYSFGELKPYIKEG